MGLDALAFSLVEFACTVGFGFVANFLAGDPGDQPAATGPEPGVTDLQESDSQQQAENGSPGQLGTEDGPTTEFDAAHHARNLTGPALTPVLFWLLPGFSVRHGPAS